MHNNKLDEMLSSTIKDLSVGSINTHIPKWCNNASVLPSIYRDVVSRATIGGRLCTQQLYFIFSSSQLNPEILGYIWNLVNKTSPGILTNQECYMALGLIALIQQNIYRGDPSVLYAITNPPVPYLSCMQTFPDHFQNSEVISSCDQSMQNSNFSVSDSQRNSYVVPTSSTHSQSEKQQTSDSSVDDFADFSSFSQNEDCKVSDDHGKINTENLSVSQTLASSNQNEFNDETNNNAEDSDFDDFTSFKSNSEASIPHEIEVSKALGILDSSFQATSSSNSLGDQDNSSIKKSEVDKIDKYAVFRELIVDEEKNVENNITVTEQISTNETETSVNNDYQLSDNLFDVSADKTEVKTSDPTDWLDFSGNVGISDEKKSSNNSITESKVNHFPPSSFDDGDCDWSDFNTSFKPGDEDLSKDKIVSTIKLDIDLDSSSNIALSSKWSDFSMSSKTSLDDKLNMSLANLDLSQCLKNKQPSINSFNDDTIDSSSASVENDDWADFGKFSGAVENDSSLSKVDDIDNLDFGTKIDSSSSEKPVIANSDFDVEIDYSSSGRPIIADAGFVADIDSSSDKPVTSNPDCGFEIGSISKKPVSVNSDIDKFPTTKESLNPQILKISELSNLDDDFGDFSSVSSFDVKDDSSFADDKSDKQSIDWSIPAKDIKQSTVPVFGDRYKNITSNAEDEHASLWERGLTKCSALLLHAANVLSNTPKPTMDEILSSSVGSQYFESIIQVYLVSKRIATSIEHSGIITSKNVDQLIQDISSSWHNVFQHLGNTQLMPSENDLDISIDVINYNSSDIKRPCGVCLLNVDSKKPMVFTYAGRFYHSPCANFWVNSVDLALPLLSPINLV